MRRKQKGQRDWQMEGGLTIGPALVLSTAVGMLKGIGTGVDFSSRIGLRGRC